MNFFAQFVKVDSSRSQNNGIVFEFSVKNGPSRNATIVSQSYELWLMRDPHSGQAEFVARLSMDLNSAPDNDVTFQPSQQRPLKLVWHYSPTELQWIEDFRQGEEPTFQIRSLLTVLAQWLKTDGSPHAKPSFGEEHISDVLTSSFPIRLKLDHETWAGVLDDVGFKHIIVHEMAVPVFPPAFGRADTHLKEAWGHHRAGRQDAAMMSCFKAFECLGHSLTGTKIPRADVVSYLMDGKEEAKKKEIESMWESISGFLHLGRHDRIAPVKLTHADGELAVVSATMLLRYLAEP